MNEIILILTPQQFSDLNLGISDAIGTHNGLGNPRRAVEYANLQKEVMAQKANQDYSLIQAKKILKVK